MGKMQFYLLLQYPICIYHLPMEVDRNLQLTLKDFYKNKIKLLYCFQKKLLIYFYFAELSSARTQVDLPQNGVRSQDLFTSTVAQRVDAKHIPGKSEKKKNNFHTVSLFLQIITKLIIFW